MNSVRSYSTKWLVVVAMNDTPQFVQEIISLLNINKHDVDNEYNTELAAKYQEQVKKSNRDKSDLS